MNNSGDAAEQVVRLSLEGIEVTAKLTGTAAKHLAVILLSVLKQEQKTMGKARLSNMIKSGKELKVFAVPQQELKKFTDHAKQYGVLYCVLKDKENKNPFRAVDVITRAEDAPKIQRIFDRYEIGKVSGMFFDEEVVEDVEQVETPATDTKEEKDPFLKTEEKETPSEKSLENEEPHDSKKPSVKEKLNKYQRQKHNGRFYKEQERLEIPKVISYER